MYSYEYPRPVVTTDAIIKFSNQILLIKRGIDPEKGKYCLPGGHVGDDENTKLACIREVYEETGIIVDNPKLLGVYEDKNRDVRRDWTINITYVFEIFEKQFPIAGDDAAEAMWVSLKDILETNEYPIAFDHYKMICDFYDNDDIFV